MLGLVIQIFAGQPKALAGKAVGRHFEAVLFHLAIQTVRLAGQPKALGQKAVGRHLEAVLSHPPGQRFQQRLTVHVWKTEAQW